MKTSPEIPAILLGDFTHMIDLLSEADLSTDERETVIDTTATALDQVRSRGEITLPAALAQRLAGVCNRVGNQKLQESRSEKAAAGNLSKERERASNGQDQRSIAYLQNVVTAFHDEAERVWQEAEAVDRGQAADREKQQRNQEGGDIQSLRDRLMNPPMN